MQVTEGKKKVIILKEHILDGKPLDFSNKNLRNLRDALVTEPRAGERLPIVQEEVVENVKEANPQGNPASNKGKESDDAEEDSPKKNQAPEPLKPPRQAEILKILQEQTTSKTASNSKTGHADENQAANVKKAKVTYKTTSIMLSYNEISDLKGLDDILSRIVPDHKSLKWVDLSFNYLEVIQDELCLLPNLMSLYLHGNMVYEMKEVMNLYNSPIKNLTLYGNQIDQIPGYRMFVITLLPQIKRLDSVLITKLEKDNSLGFGRKLNSKKLPVAAKANRPLKPKDLNADEDGEEEEKRGK
jgi:Leucine-rich repeat (LRR) protein